MTTADLTLLIKKHPVSVSCLAVALVSGVVLYLRADAIPASQAEFDTRSAEAARMIDNVKNAPNLAEQTAEIQEQTKQMETRLLRASQLAVNLQYFYKLETETGVKLIDARQADIRPTKSLYTPVPFSITIQGPSDHVMKFLAQLQNGRHFCRIKSSVFTSAGGNRGEGGGALGGQGDINLSLNIDLLGLP